MLVSRNFTYALCFGLLIFFLFPKVQAQVTVLQENFNSGSLPAGWTTNAVTGSLSWSFGIDGSSDDAGNNNLDGTSFAFFDDDALGINSVDNTTALISPLFDNTNGISSTLEFDYNFREFSVANDSFYVEVFDGTSWVTIFSRTTDDCGRYLGGCVNTGFPHASIDISAYANTNCQIRFTYHDGNNWAWYVGVDNVKVISNIPNDIGVLGIVSPNSSCLLSSNETLEVIVNNFGTDTIRNFMIACDVNNGVNLYIDTINLIIAPFDTVHYTFTSGIDLSMVDTNILTVYTINALDTNFTNDTLRYSIIREPSFLVPYFNDFEGTNNWSFGGANSSWGIGMPSGNLINSAFSGLNAAVTNLNGNYNSDESSFLISPCFDFSQLKGAPTISFYLKRVTERSYDYLELEYSTDRGSTWVRVEEENFSINWYNQADNWSGSSNSNWIKVENTLISLIGEQDVKFRFKFESDHTINFEGVAIDDFLISSSDSVDIELKQILYPTDSIASSCGLADENILILLQNKGFSTIDSAFVSYQVSSGAVIKDTLIASMLPYSELTYTFQTPHNFTNTGLYSVDVWVKVKGDTISMNDSIKSFAIQNTKTYNGYSLPYSETFDGFTDGSCANLANAYLGDVLLNDWEEKSDNLFRWHVQNGISCNGTGSILTGPMVDHTTGMGNFMFTEASVNVIIDKAIIESPCIDFTTSNTAGMQFWYHRHGFEMGNLYIDVFANGVWNLEIDSLIGQQQIRSIDPWLLKKVKFNQFAGQTIKVRFRAIKAPGFRGDMAIDDVEFYSPIQQDARLTSLNVMQSDCIADSAHFILNVNNLGSGSIAVNALKVYYQVNGSSFLVDSNISVLAVDSNVKITATAYNLYAQGNNRITVWVELANDSNAYNDTLHYEFSSLNKAPEYTEGFEGIEMLPAQCGNLSPSLNFNWEVNAGDLWVLGNHDTCYYNGGATPNTLSGPDSAYGGNSFLYFEPGFNFTTDTARLWSTCLDLRNNSNVTLEFYYHMYGAGTGKLYVELSYAGNWVRLDSIIGQQHFSRSAPWTLKSINLSQYFGEVVRVRFIAIETSGSNSSEGNIALDNVRIHAPLITSVQQEEEVENQWLLFPNPTDGKCYVQLHEKYRNNRYEILDINGKRIKAGSIEANRTLIDLSQYRKGVYFLKVEGIVETKKLIIY